MRGNAVFSFGRTMHTTLQKVFELANEKKGMGQGDLFKERKKALLASSGQAKKVNISLDEILKLYEQSWVDDWYPSKNDKEKFRKNGKDILKDFYEKHKDNWPDTIMTEKGFNMKVEADGQSYTVRGVIDRVDSMGEKIRIVDYKTGKPKEKLSFEEKEQLLIYQLAVEDLFRQEAGSLVFYYLNNNSEMEFLGTKEELGKVKEKIASTIREIKKGKFPPRPSELCKFCDFRSICEFRRT